MSDFSPDDFLPDLVDLGADVLPDDVPVDPVDAGAITETETVSEFWFAEFDAVVPDVAELALPDPFQPEAQAGLVAAAGSLLARRGQAAEPSDGRPPTQTPAQRPSVLATLASAAGLADASASAVERLARLRAKRKGA